MSRPALVLPRDGWSRVGDQAGMAVFEHRGSDGRPQDQVEVGREPDGGWFVAGYVHCM